MRHPRKCDIPPVAAAARRLVAVSTILSARVSSQDRFETRVVLGNLASVVSTSTQNFPHTCLGVWELASSSGTDSGAAALFECSFPGCAANHWKSSWAAPSEDPNNNRRSAHLSPGLYSIQLRLYDCLVPVENYATLRRWIDSCDLDSCHVHPNRTSPGATDQEEPTCEGLVCVYSQHFGGGGHFYRYAHPQVTLLDQEGVDVTARFLSVTAGGPGASAFGTSVFDIVVRGAHREGGTDTFAIPMAADNSTALPAACTADASQQCNDILDAMDCSAKWQGCHDTRHPDNLPCNQVRHQLFSPPTCTMIRTRTQPRVM